MLSVLESNAFENVIFKKKKITADIIKKVHCCVLFVFF